MYLLKTLFHLQKENLYVREISKPTCVFLLVFETLLKF